MKDRNINSMCPVREEFRFFMTPDGAFYFPSIDTVGRLRVMKNELNRIINQLITDCNNATQTEFVRGQKDAYLSIKRLLFDLKHASQQAASQPTGKKDAGG